MNLRKLGHSCLVVEEGDSIVLLDPGCFSDDLDSLVNLSAVLISHRHDDHLDLARLRRVLERNPDALVIADSASSAMLAEHDVTARAVHAGDHIDVGMMVDVYGRDHAPIHRDLPTLPNVGFLLADRFFFAGDAFTVPDRPVEILAVPVGAAWMRVSEAIDWLRTVHPRHAIPVHDHGNVFAEWIHGLFAELGPTRAEVTVLGNRPVQL